MYGLIAGPQHQHSFGTRQIARKRLRAPRPSASRACAMSCYRGACLQRRRVRQVVAVRLRRQPTPSAVTLRFGVALPKTPEASAGVRAFVNNSSRSPWSVRAGTDTRSPGSRRNGNGETTDLTLELRIRDNLKFHDGTPVDNTFIKDYSAQVFKNPNSVSYQSVSERRSARRTNSCRDQTVPPRSVASRGPVESTSR